MRALAVSIAATLFAILAAAAPDGYIENVKMRRDCVSTTPLER
jgi:hypothetical protein